MRSAYCRFWRHFSYQNLKSVDPPPWSGITWPHKWAQSKANIKLRRMPGCLVCWVFCVRCTGAAKADQIAKFSMKYFLYVAWWGYIIINKAPVHPNTPVWYPYYLLQEYQPSLACCRINIWHLQVLGLLVKLICSYSVAHCAGIQTTWHLWVNCREGLSKEQKAGKLLDGESFREKSYLY